MDRLSVPLHFLLVPHRELGGIRTVLKDNDPMYLITVERSENGKVSANYSLATPNMTVKLTMPDAPVKVAYLR